MAKKVSEELETKVEEVSVSENEVKETVSSKKNSKTALKVLIISIIVVALAVGGFFAYKMFMGKNPVKVTSGAIRGLKDKVADVKDENSEVAKIVEGDDAYEIESYIKLDLPEEIGKDYILDLLAQVDKENETYKIDVKAKEGKSTIIDLSALIDAAKVYFRFNDTMDNYYYTKLEEAASDIDFSNISELPDYDYENIIDYLADAFEGAISTKDFDKSKDELTIGGKDVKVTRYTTEIDEVKLKAIVDKFIDKVLKDKDLIKVLAQLSDSDEDDIKDALKEVKAMKASELGEVSIGYSVYVTSTGTTVGYGFEVEGVEFIIADYKDVLSIQVIASGMPIVLEFEQKSDDHVVATLDAMGMITGKLDIKTSSETIKKNKEYKETLDMELTISAMGEEIEASLNAETIVRKIDEVDTSAKKNAINVDTLSDIEQEKFIYEVEKSSTYKFLDGIFGSQEVVNYSNVYDYEY